MIRRFPSLKEPAKYGYAYDTDQYDSKAFFSDKFRQYETYGDGLCQHSRDWSVQIEHLADYLASLATTMMAGDEELISHARWNWRADVDVRKIEFAASVVFKSAKNLSGEETGYEKTRRYYSLEEMKVSSAPAKKYDKRYQQVEKWCDGSAEAICRMLIPEYARGMEYYSFADAIRDWCQDCHYKNRPYWFGGFTAQYLKWFDGDVGRARELRYAWNACKAVFAAREALDEAETALSNLHWPPAPAEEKTEAA